MIKVANVTKRFGRTAAVDDLSFSIEPGQSVALWGSNGAGKTTLIRCILGILRFKGSITIGTLDARRRGKALRRLVGYVPQELAFHDDMRLADALAFFATIRGVSLARAGTLLAEVGLAGHERKRLRDLSGGMKQRLALAIAMLSDPPLIILDEPTSNLDARARAEVVRTLRALRGRDKTVLFASHRPDEVVALADRILVIEKGRLLRDTTPAQLWPSGAPVQTMRLHVPSGREPGAATVLRNAGHVVNLNGRGLCVAVPRDRKSTPINLLLRADIEVRDFEILDEHPPEEPSP